MWAQANRGVEQRGRRTFHRHPGPQVASGERPGELHGEQPLDGAVGSTVNLADGRRGEVASEVSVVVVADSELEAGRRSGRLPV